MLWYGNRVVCSMPSMREHPGYIKWHMHVIACHIELLLYEPFVVWGPEILWTYNDSQANITASSISGCYFKATAVPIIYHSEWIVYVLFYLLFNTIRPRQNYSHLTHCIFLNENVWISLKVSLKSVPKFWINNIPSLVQIMAWHWPCDKPLSEPMMVSLLMHICIAQWVNALQLR